MNMEVLLKAINISASLLAVLCNLFALFRIWKSPFKTTRNSPWQVFSQISNVILQLLMCACIVFAKEYLIELPSYTFWADVALSILQVFVIDVNVIFGCTIIIDVLRLFAVYDLRIEEWLPFLRILLVLNFVLFGIPSIVSNTWYTLGPTETMYNFLVGSGCVYCGLAILFDNATSLFLTRTVYANSKIANTVRKDGVYRWSLIMIVGTLTLDWLGVGMVACSPLFLEMSMFIVNLTVSLTGLHIASMAFLLLNMQHLALDHVLPNPEKKKAEKMSKGNLVLLVDVAAGAKKEGESGNAKVTIKTQDKMWKDTLKQNTIDSLIVS